MFGNRNLLSCVVLLAIGVPLHVTDVAIAQEIPDSKQSVIVFDLKLDRLMENATAMGADLNQLDATTPMENIFESIKPSELKRIRGSLSLPENFDSLMTLGMAPQLPMEFFVQIEFANVDACLMMAENIENRSNEVELEGQKYWTPEARKTGVYGHRLNDTTYEFGSQSYLVHPDRNFLTPTLNSIWENVSDQALRIAMDLETPDGFIAQAIEMGRPSVDPEAEAYLDLIDNFKTVVFTVDFDSDNLVTLVADAKNAEQAEELKGGLDSLLMLFQIGGKIPAMQLAKDAPKAGAVANKILESLAATQEGTEVRFAILKPEGFNQAVAQMIAAARESRSKLADSNRFRQLGLAIHNYHETYRMFPFDVSSENELNNELSWRVRILPFLDESVLFDQMDPGAGPSAEPNAKFVEKMPSLFGDDGKLSNAVYIKSNVKTFADVSDGTSNTIMLIEYAQGEPWLTNAGLSIEDAVTLVSGLPDGQELTAVYYDGSVRKLTNKIDKETLGNLFDPRDGNVVKDY